MLIIEPKIVAYTLTFNTQHFQARYRSPNCAQFYPPSFVPNLQLMPKTDLLKKEDACWTGRRPNWRIKGSSFSYSKLMKFKKKILNQTITISHVYHGSFVMVVYTDG